MASGSISLNHVEIAYDLSGSPSEKVVLLLHCFGSNSPVLFQLPLPPPSSEDFIPRRESAKADPRGPLDSLSILLICD